MRNIQSLIFIILGTVSLLVALSIVLYNVNEDFSGNEFSSNLVAQIKSEIPTLSYVDNTPNDIDVIETPSLEDEIRTKYEDTPFTEIDEFEVTTVEQPLLYIDGNYYLGIITIPLLDLELPIFNDVTTKNLKKAPCVYDGNILNGNLILAGHNYRSHFGRIKELNTGDEIYITDANGKVYQYEVVQSEILNEYDVQGMKSNSENWDLTLFTCTLSGRSRVTVRAIFKNVQN